MINKQPFIGLNGASSIELRPSPLEYHFNRAAGSDPHHATFTDLIRQEIMDRLEDSFNVAERVSKDSICNWCLKSPETDNPFAWIEHTIKCAFEHTPQPTDFRNSAYVGEFIGEFLRRKSALTREFVDRMRDNTLSNVRYENTETKCPWCKDRSFSANSLNYYDHVQFCSRDYRRYRPY